MTPATITRLDLLLAAPEIFLLAAACVILLVDLFLDDAKRIVTFVLSLLALAGTAWSLGRCSSASVCSTTACTAARSPTTAAS